MQRILHIVGKMDRAGAETMIMNLYRALDKTKFQFDFLVFSPEEGDYDIEIKELGGRIYVINASNPIQRLIKIVSFLKSNKQYTIVHAHTLLSIGFHLLAAKLAGVKQRIAHAHSTNDAKNTTVLGKLYKQFSLRLINHCATHYLACGNEVAQFLFPWRKNILILPNSIDLHLFSQIKCNAKSYLTESFQLKDEYLKIIQIGRLIEIKNHKFSLQIASSLKEKGVPFKMFFIGQGELYEEIDIEIRNRNLSNEVILTGVRNDISKIMSGADIMIMPSLHEGFPVVLVEAQAIGLPSLVSDSVANEVDLNVGLVEFESLESDVQDWTKKIIEMVEKPKESSEKIVQVLSEKGFDSKNNAVVLENVYTSNDLK